MIDTLKKHLGRFRSPPYERATLEDLRACYRLFLLREPDETGWRAWKDLIESHQISVQMLVDGFMNGPEFRQLQEAAATPVLVPLDGFQLYVRRNDYFIGAAIARDRSYEPHVTAAVRRMLRPGDTFLDIGANIGYFTLMGSSLVGSTGRVIALEPNPSNCARVCSGRCRGDLPAGCRGHELQRHAYHRRRAGRTGGFATYSGADGGAGRFSRTARSVGRRQAGH